jgi:type I restriction enzyme S subunit
VIERARLGELVTIVGGGTPSRKRPAFYGGHIPWVTVKDFSDALTIATSTERITDIALVESAARLIPAGAVLLVTRMSVGRAMINTADVAINQDVKALRCGPHLRPKYLLFFLRHVAPRLETQGDGATVKGVTIEDVEELALPLPSLREQDRIAAILERAERLRRMHRYTIELSDCVLPATFLELFGERRAAPARWGSDEFGALGTLDRGRSRHRPRNAPHLYGGKYPFIQTGDVASSGGYIRTHTQTYSEAGLQQSKLWPAKTLCITIAANIGATGILTYPACFPDSVVGFTPGADVTVEYIQYWLRFMQRFLERTAPEVAQKNINLEILRELRCPVPPLDLQERFSLLVERHERLRSKQREALRQGDHLFQSLLHRAFT